MTLLPVHKPQSLTKKETDVYDRSPLKIMILDPHLLFRMGLVSLLKDEPDIQIQTDEDLASNLIGQISILKPSIIIMGGDLYEDGGRELMLEILSEYPDVAVLILAFTESPALMLDAVRNGAKGYLPMDFTKAILIKSLYAMARGELAISRAMATKMAEELSRLSRGLRPNLVDLEMFAGTTNDEIMLKLLISDDTVQIDVRSILKKFDS